jgi:Mn2+/Fe2+ NRAMP family transporter
VLIPRLDLLVLLFLPNVVGGILLPVILILMLKLVNDRRIMGRWTNSPRQNAIAWATAIVLIALAVVYALIALLQAAGVVNA